MRLIGKLNQEKDAFLFYSFLLREGIHSTYETAYDSEEKRKVVLFWIYEEDETDRAREALLEFQANPLDPRFQIEEFPSAPPQPPDWIAEEKEKHSKIRWTSKSRKESPSRKKVYPFTYLTILLCVILYLWNTAQQIELLRQDGELSLKVGWTPLQQHLLFDYPRSHQEMDLLLKEYSLQGYTDLKNLPPQEYSLFIAAKNLPSWKGILPKIIENTKQLSGEKPDKAPLFEKIRQGEVWRIFTPFLLHGSLLHILFNMGWALILLKPLEERLSIWKLLVLILLLGGIANVAQYLMIGPNFLGFSGVVVGFVGFIWARQKVAPWEGYPLHKNTLIFVFIYVLAMLGLEIFSLLTTIFSSKEISANIANTAHIVGGICGFLLGKTSLFRRESR